METDYLNFIDDADMIELATFINDELESIKLMAELYGYLEFLDSLNED